MIRYGISDPNALRRASRLAARAGVGYFATMIACNLGRSSGYQDLLAPQVFALTFSYAFFGIAIAAAGRRRMLLTGPGTGTLPRLITLCMLGTGLMVLTGADMTLVTLTSMMLSMD